MAPVVFIHGTRTSSLIWAEQEVFLREQGHEVVAVDLPGHGANMHLPFTLQGSYDVISAAVDTFDTPPVLVGMSLGGYIALGYAASPAGQDAKLSGLVVSACSTETKGAWVNLYGKILRRLPLKTKLTEHGLLSWSVVSDMLAEVSQMSLIQNLKQISVPLWVVNGQWDILRLGEFMSFKAANRNFTRKFIVANIGHDVNYNTHAYNKILQRFLVALPRTVSVS